METDRDNVMNYQLHGLWTQWYILIECTSFLLTVIFLMNYNHEEQFELI